MSLYEYGQAARDFPLLQYLAFYQVLEFFFLQFTREGVATRIRTHLKDPSFDLSNSRDVNRLIAVTGIAHTGLRRERDQLVETLEASITPADLIDWLSAGGRKDWFTGRQWVKGTTALRLVEDAIVGDVASRLYAIRNRIVHTKEFAESVGMELLLPSAPEARVLWPEIELVRFLASKALIHGSKLRY